MKLMELGEVFDISSSKRVHERQWTTHGVPFYRAREIVTLSSQGFVNNEVFISEELFDQYGRLYGVPEPGDLMVSAVGTLGACHIVRPSDRFYYKDASVLRFHPKVPVESKYVQFALKSRDVISQINAGSGSTVRTLTISRAQKIKIPLPPLEEQKRIARILDAADALRAKRREALARLDTLLQAIFLDLFGDPITNPKGWDIVELGDHTRKVGSGATPLGGQESYKSEGVALIRSMNVRDGIFRWNDLARIDDEQAGRLANVVVEADDVLLNITGASVARVCRAPKEVLPARVNQHVCIIRPTRSLNAKFLEKLLLSPAMKHTLLGIGEGGATRQAITKSQVLGLRVPLPPPSEQERFAAFVTAVETQISLSRKHLFELDELFASLQHRIFRSDF